MYTGRVRGFTLVELLIVVAVVGILAEISVPSFQGLLANQGVSTAASTLQFALLRTRSEGLKRNASVTLAPVVAGQWNAGWNVINPADGTNLSSYAAVSGVTITGPASVVFQGSGRLSGTSSATFKVSATNTTAIRCVVTSLTGMPAVTTSGC